MTVLALSCPLDVALRPPHRCDPPAPPRAAHACLRSSIVRPLPRSPTPGSRTVATRRSSGSSRLFAARTAAGLSDDHGRLVRSLSLLRRAVCRFETSRLVAAPCGPPRGSPTITVALSDPRRCEARSPSFRYCGGDSEYRMSSSCAWCRYGVAIRPARPPTDPMDDRLETAGREPIDAGLRRAETAAGRPSPQM